MKNLEIFEEKITDVLTDGYEALAKAKLFKESLEVKDKAINELCGMLKCEKKDLNKYINLETGEALESLDLDCDALDDLQDAIYEMNELPSCKTGEDADKYAQMKMDDAKKFIAFVRKELGSDATQIIARARTKAKDSVDFEF